MLFKNIYIWVKYKTLPPSILFKNRLFIERDTRSKRLMNNFGWLFRSSKWGTRQTPNILVKFKSLYLKYVLFFCYFVFSAILFVFLVKYFYFYFFFKSLLFILWLNIDILVYISSYFIWLFYINFHYFIKFIYMFLFYKPVSVERWSAPQPTFNNFVNNKNYNFLDYKTLIYFWLNSDNSYLYNTRYSKYILKNLFDSNLNINFWNDNFIFIKYIYKINFYINLLNFNYYTSLFNTNEQNTTYFNHHFYKLYFLSQTKSNKSQFSSNFKSALVNFNHNYNLQAIFCNNSNSLLYINSIDNHFYYANFNFFNLLNYTQSIPELFALDNSLFQSLNSFRWFRWLYRYSLVHRTSMLFTNQLKSPITNISGFLQSNNLSNNLWFNNNLFLDKYNVSNFYNALYSDLFFNSISNYNNVSKTLSVKKNLLNLSKLSNSYLWYIKRFNITNTLPLQNIHFTKLGSIPNTNIKNKLNPLNSTNFNASRLYYLTLFNDFLFFKKPTTSAWIPNSSNLHVKTVVLNYDSADLYSTDYLTNLITYTSNLYFSKNQNTIYTYLLDNNIAIKPRFNNLNNLQLDKNLINFIYLFNNQYNVFLEDLYFFTKI